MRPLLSSVLILLLFSESASALITIQGNQTGDPLGDPLFPTANVGFRYNQGGGNTTSGVYLCNGWVLTATHAGSGPISFDGGTTFYTSDPNTIHQFGTDLMLYRLDTDPGLACLDLYCATPQVGDEIVMVGGGLGSGAVSSPYPYGGFNPTGWATNRLSAVGTNGSGDHVLQTVFDDPADPPGPATSDATSYEGQSTPGDSGGGWFIDVGGSWELAGLQHAIGSQNLNAATYGDVSQAFDLTQYKTDIQDVVATPEPGSGLLAAMLLGLVALRRRRR